MGRMDYLFDRDSVQTDLDMQTLTQWQMADDIRAMRNGRSGVPLLTRGMRSGGHATSGWKNRGIFFWIVLVFCTYWFLLRPLGL